jgi:ribosomal protein S18 acetylase RimI-like enzyme
MATTLGQQVQLRPARPEDIDDIARIINDPPEPPLAAMFGQKRATRFGTLMVKSGAYPSLPHTTVAVLDGRVVGVLSCGGGTGVGPSIREFLRVLPRLAMILGPAIPRAIYGFWLRGRLSFVRDRDAFEVTELYVDATMRNRGIGGSLLERAEVLARAARAPRMSIETGVTNPARRLYERHGYRAVEEKTSVAYERLTDSPGRVMMMKELSG